MVITKPTTEGCQESSNQWNDFTYIPWHNAWPNKCEL